MVGAAVCGSAKPGTVQRRREQVNSREYLNKSFIKNRFVYKLEAGG